MKEYLFSTVAAALLSFPLLNQLVQTPVPQVPIIQKAPVIQLKKEQAKPIRRHRVQLQVVNLSDLKIVEGSQVIKNQVLSDRTEERQSLEAQKEQIEISIKQLSTPLSKVSELPPGNFAIQEAAIDKIKAEIDLLNIRPTEAGEFYRFKNNQLRQLLELDKLKAQAENKIKISESKARLAQELNQAIAALDKARSEHQHQQYQHSLNLIRQQSEMQRQQYQIASLVAQNQQVKSKLAEITQIKSPVSGRIRRIKNLGQKDRQISLEVVIDVTETDQKPSN
jgi:hypothetical protein